MRTLLVLLVLALAGCGAERREFGVSQSDLAAAATPQPSVKSCSPDHVEDLCFVPGGDCTGMVVQWIGRARSQILVQAYSFTSHPISVALIAAHRRGVDVEVVLDKSQLTARGSRLRALAAAGIPVRIERMPGIAHNKIVIIDGQWAETGSFNFTASAQKRNAENALVLSGCHVQDYLRNWRSNADRSELYGPIGG